MRNKKQPDATLEAVTAIQQRAIEALVMGRTKADAAAEAGVDRVTIWRWSRDPIFQAALNRELWELREASRARARGLVELAFGTIERQLRDNPEQHVKTAWEILKAAEIVVAAVPKPGSTCPESIRTSQIIGEEIASICGRTP